MVVKLLATTNEAHVGNMKVVGDLDSKCRDRAESKNIGLIDADAKARVLMVAARKLRSIILLVLVKQ